MHVCMNMYRQTNIDIDSVIKKKNIDKLMKRQRD